MKTLIIAALAVLPLFAANSQQGAKVQLTTQKEKESYIIGMDVGQSLKSAGAEIDMKAFSAAVEDMMKGNKPVLTEEEAGPIKQALMARMQAQGEQRAKESGSKNKKEGEAFLAANKKKPGVKTTPSGLQYQILKEGTGKKPTPADQVTVHYKGTLIDGTEFDSSYKRGEPATFPLNGVIKGWTEALQLLKEGGKMKIVLPSDIAYGERGAGQMIGPDAVLVFEIELIKIGK